MEICEFCSKEVEAIKGTSMVGAYCIECHQLTIYESRQAIKELRTKSKRKLKKQLSVNKGGYENALNALMDGPH